MTEFDPRTRHALEHLRSEWSPPPGREDAMLASFHARLDGGPPTGGGGPEGGGNAGPPPVEGVAKLVYAAKIAGAVAGLTAAGLGGLWLVGAVVRGPKAPPDRALEPRESVVVEPAAPEPERAAASSITAAPAPASSPVAERAAPARSSTGAGEPEQPALGLRARGTRPARSATGDKAGGPELAAELALIREAREAGPGEALALLERHAEGFPNGALASEREALRATALCRLDRLDEAAAVVERFVAAESSALLRERVRAACEKKIELPTTAFGRAGDGSD